MDVFALLSETFDFSQKLGTCCKLSEFLKKTTPKVFEPDCNTYFIDFFLFLCTW